MTDRELIRAAFAVRERAYTPYSHFKVGAALLTRSGRVFTGCTIENASFSPTICAERAALAAAVSAGEREFDAIAIVGSMEGKVNTLPTSPGGNGLRVILAKSEEDYQELTLGRLLPLGFGPANVEH